MGCCNGVGVELPDGFFTKEWRDKLPKMEGKVVAITGCTTGTGFVTAMELARLGARVLLLNRPSSRAEVALKRVRAATQVEDWRASDHRAHGGQRAVQPGTGAAEAQADHVDCDVSSLQSVRHAAKKVQDLLGSSGGLDALVLNAGATRGEGDTSDGFQQVIQVNHVGHMLLIKEVWPCLEAAASARGEARVCFHSSNGRIAASTKPGKADTVKTMPVAALQKNSTEKWKKDWKNEFTYYLAKSFNFVSYMELHEKLKTKGSKVKSVCAHPGMATTKTLWEGHGRCAVCVGNMVAKSMGQSEADGAMPLLMTVVDKDCASGDFYAPSGDVVLKKGDEQLKGIPQKVTLSTFEKNLLTEWRSVFEETYKGLGEDFAP